MHAERLLGKAMPGAAWTGVAVRLCAWCFCVHGLRLVLFVRIHLPCLILLGLEILQGVAFPQANNLAVL